MEPTTRQQLHRHLLTFSQTSPSPLYSALCARLAQNASPACEALFDQYFRIISATHFNLPVFLAALHHLALSGDAPELARLFPSCGGTFHPHEDDNNLVALTETALRERREELLDFLLTYEPRDPEPQRATAALLGALATAEQFGGGLSLVQLGASDALMLSFDRYAYALGPLHLGTSPLLLQPAAEGKLPAGPMPVIVGRTGLDMAPVNLDDPAERRVTEAFLPPDDLAALGRLRAAIDLHSPEAVLRQGVPELDLSRLLVEAYNAMAPGNTLFLFSILAWSRLDDEAQKRVALGLQSLAAQVKPHKPIAWLQAEPFTPGSATLELRLHTFGWADLEDRSVRKLAEAAPDLSWIQWLE